ncbi:MAG: lycopene cyclase [Nocardiaceae bacterium]|nr:lycopene cyclase [Nocardiaceae bacterium]
MTTPPPDVCIVGLGPAGRGLAHRCIQAGLRVTAVDPHPDRIWAPTYGAWKDELPTWLPESVVAAQVLEPTVYTPRARRVARPYVMFDKATLFEALPLDAASVVADRVVDLTATDVRTASGVTIKAGIVIDARGLPAPGRRPAAWAHGIFVDADRAAPFVAPGECILVDWREQNGATNDDPPSFLYAVPIGDGTVLFEEVCQGIPGGLSQRELRRRVVNRLVANRVKLTGNEEAESCHYALDQPPPRRRRGGQAFPYGSRGGLMHPCTGYSVAASLRMADTVVEALIEGIDPGRRLWTERARAVYWMRMRGLAGIGRLTNEQSAATFDAFFRAPLRQNQALLSSHDDVTGIGAVLVNTVHHTWPFRWRFDLVGWTNRKRWVR